MFTVGMTIPAGSTEIECLTGYQTINNQITAPYTVPDYENWCKANVPYLPATFWEDEPCTPDGESCVLNYDNHTLRRYEIRDGNTFPSGRSYEDEIQNFANWYTYYRKRRLMLAASVGEVLENITGLRMGVVDFINAAPPTMFDADDPDPAANRLAVSGWFYTAENRNDIGTPMNTAMKYIRDQFDTNPNIIQYACQRNTSFIITDGFANDLPLTPLSYDGNTYGATAPYKETAPDFLADKALAYFTLPLRQTVSPLALGKVPLGDQDKVNPDSNTNLHVNTYALTLGARGTIWPTTTDPFVTPPTWPQPVRGRSTMIDDLWHATINGRGLMFSADNATDTAAAIRAGLLDIISQTGAQSSIAVTNPNLQRSDARAYYGLYNPAGWTGDLTANAIDKTTGVISNAPAWSANARLMARTTARVIASKSGPFNAATVGATVNPGNVYGNTADVIDYLRGDRSKEGTTFRTRRALMGAVINAQPVTADGVVYVASGEGMLHAIDAASGDELWAFVPPAVLPAIGKTTGRAYTFRTQLDGGPVIGTVANKKRLLVAGMGAAGRSYYALDITSPRGLNESQLATKALWEFPTAANADKVGQTLGHPAIVRLDDNSYRVLVTSGYNSAYDGKGRLWMLNPENANDAPVEFVTTEGTRTNEAGLAHVSAFIETDGSVRYAFAGDLLGNLWRFDLKNKSVKRVAVLRDAAGLPQPVTAAPELIYYKGKRIVLIGTGRLLDIDDFGNGATQSFYAIADDDEGAAVLDPRNSPLSMKKLTYAEGSNTITGAKVDWTQDRGWYVDLPPGEQANTKPRVEQGLLAFTTNVDGATDCSASSYLYTLNVTDGTKPPDIVIRTVLSTIANSTGVTLVQTSDGSIRVLTRTFDDGDGNSQGTEPPVIKPAKNAWRDVRR
jgi:type IV pilus assembly protein PilY1